jgi:pyruvate dehydrogenase E2 component (dihydrolipoamide acetyltransferase)
MPELLLMPEIAAATTSAVLSQWPVAEHAPFSARDVIATVETDKAVVDVEAESDGVILATLVAAGTEVAVGSAIAVLGRHGEQVDDLDAVLASLGVAGPAAPAPPPTPDAGPLPATPGNGQVRKFASPLARRMAARSGLLLEDLTGTGPGGRIVRRDVETAIVQRVALEEPDVQAIPPVVTPPAAGSFDQPLSRMRRAIAARLTESKATTPHFYLRGSARVDRLLQLRAELNEGALDPGGPGVRISVNDLLVKAVAQAHLLVPEMNVTWTGEAIRSYSGVDVAVAVATDDGLVTPVLRGVESMSVRAVARATQDAVERARAGRLQQRELEGGTISVTNLGMYGTEEFAAILNPPQAAILAVGAARQEPVVTHGELAVGTVLRVTLSVDHRPVDGATAARWMQAFVSVLETPVRILA